MDNRWILLTVLEVISGATIVHLWSRHVPIARKFAWTFIGVLPLLGPLLYFGLFRIPAPHGMDHAKPAPDPSRLVDGDVGIES